MFNLTAKKMLTQVEYVLGSGFDGILCIPEGIDVIGDKCCKYIKDELKSVVVESPVIEIREGAFDGCRKLRTFEFNIDSSNITIGKGAFRNCIQLFSIDLPNAPITIMDETFRGCFGLHKINFPDQLISIGKNAFNHCINLEKAEIPPTTVVSDGAFMNCFSLKYISFPKDHKIPSKICFGCITLSDITIPDTVCFIDRSAFYNCQSLRRIDIPHNVNHIYENAFAECISLHDVIINGGTSLFSNAFENCIDLSNVWFYNKFASFQNDTFAGCPTSMVLHVRHDSIAEKCARDGKFNFIYIEEDEHV